MLPLLLAELAVSVPVLQAWHMPWMVVLVLATGIGAFLGYNIALERNGPVLTSATLTLTPVYAAALAMLLVGEQLAWYHGVALVLVVTGLLLVNRGQINATLAHERAPVDRSRTVLPDRSTRQDP
jgi:drug/metabolite transporter (DMT)-like permease